MGTTKSCKINILKLILGYIKSKIKKLMVNFQEYTIIDGIKANRYSIWLKITILK